MQRIISAALGFVLLLLYWSVSDTLDNKLFGPTQAANITSPDKAVYAIDLYPGARVKENNVEHEEAYDGHPAQWQYTWLCEVPQSASVVADFYQRRMGAPHEDEDEGGLVYAKEHTRVALAPDPENAEHTLLYIVQSVPSNASSLGWKTRSTIIKVVIFGGLAALCTLGLFLTRKATRPAEEAPVVTYAPPPLETPPAPAPVVDESAAFFQELEAALAGTKYRRDRFDLTIQPPGKAPAQVDIEPLFYLWKRPGVDRAQAIHQFLEGRLR